MQSTTEPSQNKPELARLESLFRQILRVTVSDGRIFIGTFAGTDQPLNILLMNSEEYRVGSGENMDGRYVGQIVIPWKLIVKVEGEASKRHDTRSQNMVSRLALIIYPKQSPRPEDLYRSCDKLRHRHNQPRHGRLVKKSVLGSYTHSAKTHYSS